MLPIETIKETFEQRKGMMRTRELYEAHIFCNDI